MKHLLKLMLCLFSMFAISSCNQAPSESVSLDTPSTSENSSISESASDSISNTIETESSETSSTPNYDVENIVIEDKDDLVILRLESYGSMSSIPGNPIKINIEDATLKCNLTHGSFNWGKYKPTHEISSEREFYWVHYDYLNGGEDVPYGVIDVTIYQEGYIVGYAVILILDNGNRMWFNTVVESKIFPKVNGQYQDVPQEYVDDLIYRQVKVACQHAETELEKRS